MLISDFARATGLSRDTVRFYVRLGLLQPRATAKGGSRPYQVFAAADVRAARIIRVSQSLGMSLKEIAGVAKERRAGRITRKRSADILRGRLETLETKAVELQAMTAYLRAKIAWTDEGGQGPPPDFEEYLAAASAIAPARNNGRSPSAVP